MSAAPQLYGGLQAEKKEPEGDIFRPVFYKQVTFDIFVAIVLEKLDFIIWDKSPHSTSRLYTRKTNKEKRYSIIKLVNRRSEIRVDWAICEYHGFFIAQSNHEVSMGDIKKFVVAGSYILKLGKVLQTGSDIKE